MSVILGEASFFLMITLMFVTHLLFANGICREPDSFKSDISAPKYIKFTFGHERFLSIIYCFLAVLWFSLNLLTKIPHWLNWNFLDYGLVSGSFVATLISFVVLKTTKTLIAEENREVKSQKTSVTFLLKIADLLPRKQRQILQQEALTMKEEHDEAILFGKTLRAKVITTSYYIGISWSVGMWIADKIKEVVKIIPKKN